MLSAVDANHEVVNSAFLKIEKLIKETCNDCNNDITWFIPIGLNNNQYEFIKSSLVDWGYNISEIEDENNVVVELLISWDKPNSEALTTI